MIVEFETEIRNGSIEIPEKLRYRIKDKIKVLVSIKEAEKTEEEPFVPLTRDEIYDRRRDRAENFIKWLMKHPLKVDKSIPFLTRDEIYDRKL
jgi:hypothetical protein